MTMLCIQDLTIGEVGDIRCIDIDGTMTRVVVRSGPYNTEGACDASCEGGGGPQVDVDDQQVCSDYMGSFTFTGVGFDLGSADLRDSASVPVAFTAISSTTTSVTGTLTGPVANLGPFYAKVTNADGFDSGFVQIGDILDCPTITRSPQGKTSSSGLGAVATIAGVVLAPADYLVVAVGVASAGGTTLPTSVKYNGVDMDPLGIGDTAVISGIDMTPYWYGISGSTTSGSHSVVVQSNGGIVSLVQVAAETIQNLTSETLDISSTNTGLASVPEMGGDITTFPSEIAYGIVFLATASGAETWQNDFTTCGQDVSTVFTAITFKLLTGYKLVNPEAVVEPALDVAAAAWSGLAESLE